MFNSIRWKFIVVYFLLVFIAMVIVGVFIVQKFEMQQLENRTSSMTKQIESIISASSYLSEDNWAEVSNEIQSMLNEWRFDGAETLYIIYEYEENIPRIIATSSKKQDQTVGKNALRYKDFDPTLILSAYEGEKKEAVKKDLNKDEIFKHLAYPVLNEVGQVKGVFYMTSDLQDIYDTLDESKKILTSATMLALIITIILGFLIASSITEPIRDVTKKAERMAKGDFDQFVEVKSEDEIGQLASMFNYLTLKLKNTIQEMDLERSKLDTIFKYMADGVIAIDLNGYIIHANPIAVNILGLEDTINEELLNRKVFPIENINLKKIDYNDVNTLEGDDIVEINSIVYRMRYAPFRNEKGYIGGIIIVFQDITEQHKLDNMRKEFVANVSHELKTPITTIKSYTETLMDYKDIDEELACKFLSIIDSECDRMARIVKNLLQLSNLDYNKTKWNKIEYSVKKLIYDSCSKLEFAFKEKGHTLHIDIEDDIPDIVIDKDGIEQVILNIISNAIKYTPNNGNIDVSAKYKDNKVIISVKDNGIGIPEEDKDRIFERFYRVDKGRSRELGGTGLGLSIAKQIVEAHDGDIIFKSQYKVGTKVDIILPVATNVSLNLN
ncbi:PAS/PAC sensor signal transduction histidine kinase [Keratinibaculum paraultunense]|uniref:histidine kinase n=1 Tax=Keratinibaculum paraultunense TaxID=1278232 RepID=A0A4V2UTP0_9FIRM|nr:ATP-binding protein [Keratinibaculum paraultunense]QQY79739.1 HAMP domain-containing protein [Keratinibaculum paraultunense]TCS86952.1 PAS/PAC sensor signal transduction histidine kinase [Keratinibaculum paraultunense]